MHGNGVCGVVLGVITSGHLGHSALGWRWRVIIANRVQQYVSALLGIHQAASLANSPASMQQALEADLFFNSAVTPIGWVFCCDRC